MKTRFCPSPTGYMHLGNTRTALFNVLLALSRGDFLLRIEDTDQSRSTGHYADFLLDDLQWLGVEWQEGPRVDGPNGPYYQSQRQEIYDHYYESLESRKLAYPCFCSEEQLALNRKVQRGQGLPPRYPGTCRNLSSDEVALKLSSGEKPTLRFLVPDDQEIRFDDLVRGEQVFQSNDIGDFIIRRADGTASFMFCNAVDDALMGVTHAMRGEDHLTNTPRQILILQALGLTAPTYGHIALILGMDGAPLSKRNGSRSIKDLRETGFLRAAVLNYLARLGHYYASNDFMSLQQLSSEFDCNSLGKSPAKFDEQQLLHWQKEAVMQADTQALLNWLEQPVLEQVEDHNEFIEVVRANVLFPEELKFWVRAIFDDNIEHSHDGLQVIKEAGLAFFETAIEILANEEFDYKILCDQLKSRAGVKGKALFMPLRVALTGEKHGPELARVLPLMGLERVKNAWNLLCIQFNGCEICYKFIIVLLDKNRFLNR